MSGVRSWINELSRAWSRRWSIKLGTGQYRPDEVPCVLADVNGSAFVAPSTITFQPVRRGPFGIKYLDDTARRVVPVDSIDKGSTTSVVRSRGDTVEWTVPDARLAAWAFDVAAMWGRSVVVPERPPLTPPSRWGD